jgi:Barstar (barnase inhibitor)
LRWSDLIADQFTGTAIVASNERSVDNLVRGNWEQKENRDPSINVRFIRGKRCRSSSRLFQEWAAALQFPYYFGHNWDAFNECICDLDWIKPTRHLIFITNADQILRDEERVLSSFVRNLRIGRKVRDEFSIFVSILMGAQHYWMHELPDQNGWMRLIFQCDPERAELVQERFGRAGFDIPLLRLQPDAIDCDL